MNTTLTHRVRQLLVSALSLLPAYGLAFQVAETPLFLTTAVPANVILTLDDSGSMCWGFAPGASSYNSSARGPFTTPATVPGYGNGMYYNPKTAYKIPTIPTTTGVSRSYTTSFNSARKDGFSTSEASVDLSNNYAPPTGSYCNNQGGGASTTSYTCTARVGVDTLTCDAVFTSGASASKTCNNTTFTHNSYTSTCQVTFVHTTNNGGRNYVSANNCADTSRAPFAGLSPGSNVNIGALQYTLSGTQNGLADGANTIRVTQTVTTNATPSSLSVSWNQGNDTIACSGNGSNNFFSGLSSGSTVTVSGNNNNGGTYTLASNPTNSNRTIAVNSSVVAQAGATATFTWSTGSGSTITVSNCGNNPFNALNSGDSVTVSGSSSNNGTYTLASDPTNSNRTLTISGTTLTSENASNVLFSWPNGSLNRITASNCVDSNGDVNNSPFSGLQQNDAITLSGALTGSYQLNSDPSNNDTTLTLTSNLTSSGIFSPVTFSWTTGGGGGGGTTGVGAYYDIYYADLVGQSKPGLCSPDNRSTTACYVRVTVGSATDLTYSGWADADSSKLNFARWYSFYRTRALTVMSGATNAISSFDNDEIRLAWQTINKCTDFSTCLGYDNRMHSLNTTHRNNFHGWLEGFVPGGSTPLRSAMRRAGQYYTQSGINGPYATVPGGDATELTCRKNFHILFTDGYWNQDDAFTIGGNLDNTATTFPDGNSYTARPPYKDDNSNNLADIAFYYWKTDLRTDLANQVKPYTIDQSAGSYWNARNDPATWQHMSNFTIGLGLSADMGTDWGGTTYLGAYNDLVSGAQSWPTTGSNAAGNVYDLWHAALNSRGQFFSADSPEGLDDAFASIVNAIQKGNPSAASVAANSTSVKPNETLIYQASFDGSDWSGHLKAIEVLTDGSIGARVWDAATLIPSHATRKIFTYNQSTNAGTTFDATACAALSSPQKTALSGCSTNLINYLRGDTSKEIQFTGGVYRNRSTTVLGDIINSDPAYTFREDQGYTTAAGLTDSERTSYAAFVTGKTSRPPMVYVGANDGMLHGFNGDSLSATGGGQEVFAYVPAAVYPSFPALAQPNYSHQYLVDGPPTVGDAYIGAWKTYLLAGLNAGGNSIYALDVSSPTTFSATEVKWEYTDSTGDLGQTFSKPLIARLATGQWAAIFGNGYNSGNGHAVLYVVNLANGTLIQKLDTFALDTNTTEDNGLSNVVLYSSANNGVTDTVYGGDLHGNMWKFDLSSATSANWSASTAKLFTATNSSGQAQPILYQPTVGANPNGGVLVYFGTGRYLTTGDVSDKTVQTFYAIWDKPSASSSGTLARVARSTLKQQYITLENFSATIAGGISIPFAIRETTAGSVDYATQNGWFMDLQIYSQSGTTYTAGTPEGERLHSTPLLKDGRVIFVTLIPSTDSCSPGGASWLMELDAINGSSTSTSSFDFNNDNTYSAADVLSSGRTASGIRLDTVGIATTPTWLGLNNTSAIKIFTGSTGETMSIKNKAPMECTGNCGHRIHWQQIL